jgi:signal transduction histidine kinase
MNTKLAQRTFFIRAQSSELNDRAFDQELLPQFFHLFHRRSLSSLERVVFDLRRVRWGNPYGALGIVLMAEVLRDYSPWSLEAWLAQPQRRKRNTWLAHIGLPQAMAGLAAVQGDLQDEAELVSRFRFLPITGLPPRRADQMKLLKDVAVHTHAVLVREFAYDAVQAGRFITALSELCTNIYDHSTPGGEVRGFIAMQAYRDTVKFAVMDLGIGIPKSLRGRFDLDDAQLIQKAFEPGVSARQDEGRGLGLARVAEIVEHQHGILNIRSGRAKVLLRGRQRHREIHKLQHRNTFPGTQIGILLRRVGSGKKETR